MFVPRTLAETDGGPGRPAIVRAIVVAIFVTVALTAILTISFSPGQVDLEVGQVATQDIRAPRSATFISQSQTEAAKDAAAAGVSWQYEQLLPPADNRVQQLRAYGFMVNRVASVLDRRDTEGLGADETSAVLEEAVPELTDSQRELTAGMSISVWQRTADAGRTVLDSTLGSSIREEDVAEIQRSVRELITTELPEAERSLAGELAARYVQFNLARSAQLTEQAREEARAAVAPVQIEVREGEAIARTGDLITIEAIEKLEELGLTQPRVELATLVGNGLVAALLSALLVGFLWRFQPQIWHRNRSLLLFVLALLVSAVAIRVSGDRTLWTYVVPVAATVMLIAILLDSHAGAAMAAALALLAGVVNRETLEPAVYILAGGTAALLALVHAERLNAFVRAGIVLALTNVTVVVAFSLLAQRDATAIAQLAVAGLVNAGLAVLLAVGSFAMLGSLFGIMTVFQLLELANPSNRLLRRLLLETPGTYHHSVMVGNLAERAAETIGADPLLVRVASYYHDIGKTKNPLAFIENQAGSRNIHDDLSAETSARIIAGHIRDGIDLGYEHGLPVQIIGFVPQHHGTSVMGYFHTKALEEVGGDESRIDQSLYRYPGPKPQSREAAILMLADGVEASVRSLDTKDDASIRAMVDSIIDARVEDGQLDDADLTLKNIRQIKDAFVQQLLGMYHSRIKYPDNVLPLERREQA